MKPELEIIDLLNLLDPIYLINKLVNSINYNVCVITIA